MLVSSKISSKVVSRGNHFFPILVLLSAFRTCFLFIILRYNVTNVVFNKWHSVDNGTLCQIALSNCVVMQIHAEPSKIFQNLSEICACMCAWQSIQEYCLVLLWRWTMWPAWRWTSRPTCWPIRRWTSWRCYPMS